MGRQAGAPLNFNTEKRGGGRRAPGKCRVGESWRSGTEQGRGKSYAPGRPSENPKETPGKNLGYGPKASALGVGLAEGSGKVTKTTSAALAVLGPSARPRPGAHYTSR